MKLADASDDQTASGDAFHSTTADDARGGITAPKVVGADGEEDDETQCGCHDPSGDHEGGKPNIGQEEGSSLGGPPHPSEMNRHGTVHGAVRKTNEHHTK